MLVMFSPIFVADTKVVFGCNFGALPNMPLTEITALDKRIKYNFVKTAKHAKVATIYAMWKKICQ